MKYNEFIELINVGHEAEGRIALHHFAIINVDNVPLIVFRGFTEEFKESNFIFGCYTLKELFERGLVLIDDIF